MKKSIVLTGILLVCFCSCKTSKPVAIVAPPVNQKTTSDPVSQAIDFSDQSTWILGYFDLNRLFLPPHSTWFISGYDDYKYDSEAVNKLKAIDKSNITLKIVMGTWCPDSRREVPGFMRVLNAAGFTPDKFQFIGVDNLKNSPVEDYRSLNIQRVPTFIIYKNNIEAGRIIENPATSLELDMVNILTRNE
jgi:thiol-disulfide isomerase/thioredoxin